MVEMGPSEIDASSMSEPDNPFNCDAKDKTRGEGFGRGSSSEESTFHLWMLSCTTLRCR
jgi:hypothetical protein